MVVYPIIHKVFLRPRWCRISSINSSLAKRRLRQLFTCTYTYTRIKRVLYLYIYFQSAASAWMVLFGKKIFPGSFKRRSNDSTSERKHLQSKPLHWNDLRQHVWKPTPLNVNLLFCPVPNLEKPLQCWFAKHVPFFGGWGLLQKSP